MGIITRDLGAHKGGPRVTARRAPACHADSGPSLPNEGTSRRESQTPGSGPVFGFQGPATSSTAGGVGERQTQGLTPEFDFPVSRGGGAGRVMPRGRSGSRAIRRARSPRRQSVRGISPARQARWSGPSSRHAWQEFTNHGGAVGIARARRSRRPPPRPGAQPGPSRG